MASVSLGPLALPLGALVLAVAFAAAAGVGRLAGRRSGTRIAGTLADMLLAGIAVSRLGFVARWHELYRESPLGALDIRDGGFDPWAGIAAALAVGAWQAWRREPLRRPLAAGLGAGVLVAAAAFSAVRLLDPPDGRRMPALELATLAGDPATLASVAGGRPLVVNLWATWCPPCRREMPVLAAAQRDELRVTFVFANQGETMETVAGYLAAEKLELANVLMDPGARLGHETRSAGLPTTLFYDAQGRLVDQHMGALSAASLAAKLVKLGIRPGAGAGAGSSPSR